MRTAIRVLLLLIGVNHLVVTLLTFFAPEWFFANIGYFPPFNHHFLADIGAFNAPLGVALLIAARDPERHRLLIGLAALGNLLHSLSHLRDAHLHMPPHMPLAVGIAQEAAILLVGLILLGIAARAPQPAQRGQDGQREYAT